MREVITKVFTYDELSEQAKERAYMDWVHQGGDEWHWVDEWREALKGFADLTNIRLRDYELDSYGYWFSAEYPDIEHGNVIEYQPKDCPFSGTTFDEDFLHPLREWVSKKTDADYLDVLKDCLDTGFRNAQSDIEWHSGKECFIERCEFDGYEFTEDGMVWR